jgi:hypothetical protein
MQMRTTRTLRSIYSTALPLTLLAGLLVAPAHDARALSFAPGTQFVLQNHPDDHLSPPSWGMRLDGISGFEDHVISFDFENAVQVDPETGMEHRARMFLRFLDGGGVRIFGTAFGGIDAGHTYLNGQFWDIDFTYPVLEMRGDQLVTPPPTETVFGSGSITALTDGFFDEGFRVDLVDFSGDKDFSFGLAFDYRGAEGVLSGFGWLNHSVGGLDNHVVTSDWLFVAVPEPRTLLLVTIGLGLLAWESRRGALQHARAARVAD